MMPAGVLLLLHLPSRYIVCDTVYTSSFYVPTQSGPAEASSTTRDVQVHVYVDYTILIKAHYQYAIRRLDLL